MTREQDLRATVASAFDEPVAGWVRNGVAKMDAFAVQGFPENAVWRVRVDELDHPLQAYVGLWPNGGVRVLTDDQPAFLELAEACRVELADSQAAIRYVLAFLEVTRGPMVLVQPISSADDIRWRPGTDEEEARKRAFLSQANVQPPAARPTEDGFRVEMWLVVDQRVQVNRFDVSRRGEIASSFKTVASDLPLPVAW